jgi:polyphosphate kinase
MSSDLSVRAQSSPLAPDIEARPDAPEAFFNRELSWLSFARRVMALVESPSLPLFERVQFAGISGLLHDEFFMKRMSGLKRQIRRGSTKRSLDGKPPQEEFEACRRELADQVVRVATVVEKEIRPALERHGVGIVDYRCLEADQRATLRQYFEQAVLPILTPLTVDPEHPFPFISSLGLNLAILVPDDERGRGRFVRVKVPNNRPRWVPLPDGAGFTPLEQVIAHNLDLLYPTAPPREVHLFRVTRGAEGERSEEAQDDAALDEPGGIVEQVSKELKARRFAGVVRLEVDADMPEDLRAFLARQLGMGPDDVYPTPTFIGLNDLLQYRVSGHDDLRFPAHESVTHPRLKGLGDEPGAIFGAISAGDILLHHPYHSFDTSVLRFIESAARDPQVLAIKLTIYRTSSDSPIVRALADASRHGKQVAVLVEITARFDEAPNIAWGKFLETEGVHVAYGVEDLKTHVKLALVVREEGGQVRQYAHIGTGNYHPGTARLYEDLGFLTADPAICAEVAEVFNALTGATPYRDHRQLLVAPLSMRARFTELIHREIAHARGGRPSGIVAKMNQLQDASMIRELYGASRAGVPINLLVRGLCCLRPGVPGLSETVRVSSVVGRFLEHSRVYRFENGGTPEFYVGSADWMARNLDSRVETVVAVTDPALQHELDAMLEVYERDNCSAWDCRADGTYERRVPAPGEPARAAQEVFIASVRKRKSGETASRSSSGTTAG